MRPDPLYNPDLTRQRAYLTSSVASYDYIGGFYGLLGLRSHYEMLSSEQKDYFNSTTPIFNFLERLCSRLRIMGGFCLFL